MTLLFFEPDDRYYEWLTAAIRGHDCLRAKTTEEIEEIANAMTVDAIFVDLCAVKDVEVLVAKIKLAAQSAPIIILNGRELRADLVKVCDGFISKAALSEPGSEIPNAAAYGINQKSKQHQYDDTAQLMTMLRSLRMAKS